MLGAYCIEVWKPIEGFPEYQVSSFGRVRSSRRWGRFKVMNPSKIGEYKRLALHADSKPKGFYVHQLVYRTFYGPVPQGLQIRHLDGNAQNNHICNLSVGTSKENHADRYRHGTEPRCERGPSSKLSRNDVLEIFNACRNGVSRQHMARKFSVDVSAIRRIMRGQTWAEVTGMKRIERQPKCKR